MRFRVRSKSFSRGAFQELAREKSQEKGREFQKAVLRWLGEVPLWSLRPSDYGDAYEISDGAAEICGEYFDFSLKLNDKEKPKNILYVECKYRNEATGNVNKEFTEFVATICLLSSRMKDDQIGYARFCFISNIPPDKWRIFLKDKIQFAQKECNVDIKGMSGRSVSFIQDSVHVLVLNLGMVA